MKTIFKSSNLIPLVLGVFLAVRLVGVGTPASLYGARPVNALAINGTKETTGNVSVADSTSILGLFGMATATTGTIKRKIGAKKAS